MGNVEKTDFPAGFFDLLLAQQQKTGEYGTVTIRPDGSGFGYTTHHFSRRELVELLGYDWEILVEEHPVLTTKNENNYPSHR